MLKIRCPKCDKGENFELLDVMPEKRYRLTCGDCEFSYTLAYPGVEPERKKRKGYGERVYDGL